MVFLVYIKITINDRNLIIMHEFIMHHFYIHVCDGLVHSEVGNCVNTATYLNKLQIELTDDQVTYMKEMIFAQLFWYNFYTTFSLILTSSYYFISYFLSLLFLTNKKREQQGCPKIYTKIVVQISLLHT